MTQADITLPSRRVSVAEWLTVERVAYGGMALLALGLRAYGLARLPLGPAEAANALPAWQAVQGGAFDLTRLSPLLFNLQRALMIPFGGSDAIPRWPAALLGALAVLLFYGLRSRLTRPGALAAALLWTLSPIAVFFGRQGLPYGLVPPLALGLLVALSLYFEEGAGDRSCAEDGGVIHGGARWLTWAGVALGLLLAAGPGAYAVVVTGIIAALVWRPAWRTLWAGVAANWRRLALVWLLAFVLASTAFLTLAGGLAAAVDLLGQWVRHLLPGAAPALGDQGYSAWDVLRRVLVSEPLLVGLGVAGAVAATRRRDSFGLLVGLGTAVPLVVALVATGRHPGDLGLVVMGLCLLGGPALAGILEMLAGWRGDVDAWLLAALSLVLLIAAGISLPGIVSPGPDDLRRMFLLVTLVSGVLCVLLWLTFSLWGSADVVRRVIPVVALVIGSAWMISQMAGISYNTDMEHYAGVLAQVPGAGWQDLRSELRNLSPLHGTGKNEAALDVWVNATGAGGTDGLAAMLAWELKDDPHMQVVGSLPAQPPGLIITPMAPGAKPGDAAAAPAGIPPTYRGTQVDVLDTWRPDGLTGTDAWVRWLLYREIPEGLPIERRSVVLWEDPTAGKPLAPAPLAAPPALPGADQGAAPAQQGQPAGGGAQQQ